MDNRVWVKDAVMTIRLPEEVDHFVADRLREEAGEILVERNVREVVFDFRRCSSNPTPAQHPFWSAKRER